MLNNKTSELSGNTCFNYQISVTRRIFIKLFYCHSLAVTSSALRTVNGGKSMASFKTFFASKQMRLYRRKEERKKETKKETKKQRKRMEDSRFCQGKEDRKLMRLLQMQEMTVAIS
jgi:hypothetical protein